MDTPTTGDDTLIGNNNENFIDALAGNDTVQASGGQDTIYGNDGDDVLYGGNDTDEIYGGNDNDFIDGGDDEDQIFAGEGDDVIRIVGDDVADIINAEGGNDTIDLSAVVAHVGYTVDLENELYYDDSNKGGLANARTISGIENILGTGSVDVLIGDAVDNSISGNAGNDTLTGGGGADDLKGGLGDDTYYADADDTLFESSSQGTDTVHILTSLTLVAEIENLVLDGTDAVNGTGNARNNRLTGNDADNVLNGITGNDTLIGNDGNDTFVTDGNDTLTESQDKGTDTVQSSVSHTLLANFENLVLTGSGVINATGNTGDNSLTGNSKANVLDGHGGVDTMAGGAGNDTYITDGLDTLTESGNQGTDTVQTGLSFTLAFNFENLTLTGTLASNATGNAAVNVLTGNSAANKIDGLGGADTLKGGDGDDIYVTDGLDKIIESVGKGSDSVQSTASFTLGSNLENLTLVGTTATTATGNTLANHLIGTAFANTLDGGSGNDLLEGAGGNDKIFGRVGQDTMTGGLGGDTFVFDSAATAANLDTITDFEKADTIQLDNSVYGVLAAGVLAKTAFVTNTSGLAADADDRIIYESDSGRLWYDKDGQGGSVHVQIAKLDAGLVLTSADFFVI